MRVLAFDPGYDRLGVAVLEKKDGREQLIHSECVITDRSAPFPDRLCALGNAVDALIRTHAPDLIALESLFFNKNTTTAFNVAEVRGAVIYLARHHNCPVVEFNPQEVKVAVTGYGKSDKSAVTAMIKRLIPGVPKKALDDEYDAIAVGITAIAHARSHVL